MSDADEVWARMRAVYEGFSVGDVAAVDALLHPDVTIWDSSEFALCRGHDGLAALRARRGPGGPSVASLAPTDPVVDVWDDTALVRHILTVSFDDGTVETVRNTSVWRRTDAGWFAVHNHEDVMSP